MSRISLTLLVIPLLIVGGCSSKSGGLGDVPVEDRGMEGKDGSGYQEGQTGGYSEYGMQDGSMLEGGYVVTPDSINDPNSPLAIRTVYFEYDSSSINEDGEITLTAHAKYLQLVPSAQLVLEGHTDERGTRDYNLALGERRANSVKDFLLANGVSSSQLMSKSYGEENPVALESTDAAWQLNRRVELLYGGN